MKLSSALFWKTFVVVPIVRAALTPGPEFIHLNKNDSMVVVADLQESLYNTVRDYDPTVSRNKIIAHATIAKIFSLPIVLTTSAETGSNGNLLKEIATLAAIAAQKKSPIILAGFTTDVSSGIFSPQLASNANRRMENASVILPDIFAIIIDLIRDWRNTRRSS
ncbi:hypothetical protein BDR22DRAFT_899382 [Usnea florida]